jgi:hypothetical protein
MNGVEFGWSLSSASGVEASEIVSDLSPDWEEKYGRANQTIVENEQAPPQLTQNDTDEETQNAT